MHQSCCWLITSRPCACQPSRREHDKQARICAAEGLDHVRCLARLTKLVLIDRERRMVERRIKSAKFPAVKSLPSREIAWQCTAGQWTASTSKPSPA